MRRFIIEQNYELILNKNVQNNKNGNILKPSKSIFDIKIILNRIQK